MEILNTKDYPYVGIGEKVLVLDFLTETILETTDVRNALLVDGVQEKDNLYQRQMPLGYDKAGGIYWLVVRRVFVERENEIFYYSSVSQFETLCSMLRRTEPKLSQVIDAHKNEIIEELSITEKMTRKVNKTKHLSYLDHRATTAKSTTDLFRLGMENNPYVNHMNDPFAHGICDIIKLSKGFTLAAITNFKWIENRASIAILLRKAIELLEKSLILPFMHPYWATLRKEWLHAVSCATAPKDFANVLITLQSCVKPALFVDGWHTKPGYIRMKRCSLEESEREKESYAEKCENIRSKSANNFVKNSVTWYKRRWTKQIGEEYRSGGGWLWMANKKKTPESTKKESSHRSANLLIWDDLLARRIALHLEDGKDTEFVTIDRQTSSPPLNQEFVNLLGKAISYARDEIIELSEQDLHICDDGTCNVKTPAFSINELQKMFCTSP